MNGLVLPPAHLVPVVACHLHLYCPARTNLGERDEIVECGFTRAFHPQKPFELRSRRLRREEGIEIVLVKRMAESSELIPARKFLGVSGEIAESETGIAMSAAQQLLLPRPL